MAAFVLNRVDNFKVCEYNKMKANNVFWRKLWKNIYFLPILPAI